MAILTTGLIKNIEVSGVRPSSTFSVRFSNTDLVSASIRMNGFYWNARTKTEYVLDVLTLAPGEVASSNFYAQFDAFEFRFVTSSDLVEISACGKNVTGDVNVVYNMQPAELFSMGTEGIPGATRVSAFNRIYIPDYSNNKVSVIDGKTNTVQGNIIVGSGPYGVGVNPTTNRIYVANYNSNTVSVIDGSTNTVITTVAVSTNPVGVGVNPVTSRIYVTNQGSDSVSVIDGFINVVIGTIMVGTSPVGVDVNSTTNRIYISNQGNNNVSVINGSTNTVIATTELGS